MCEGPILRAIVGSVAALVWSVDAFKGSRLTATGGTLLWSFKMPFRANLYTQVQALVIVSQQLEHRPWHTPLDTVRAMIIAAQECVMQVQR